MPEGTPTAPTTPPVAPPASERRVKARYVVAALVCVGAVAWLVVGGLATNMVYLRPVTEAIEQREELGTKRFRMGGTVVPGSIGETGAGVRFEIVDGTAVAAVDHRGDPPDLFKDCAPVVVEGRWAGDVFRSDRLLIKHGEEYRPPEAGAGEDCEHPGGLSKGGG